MVRINGLIKATKLVRQQLQLGIRPAEIPRFQQQVASLVQQVDAICAQHRLTPDQLPAPSRQAYRYLRELDTNDLPVRHKDVKQTTATFGVKNLIKTGDGLAELLWEQSAHHSDQESTPQSLREIIQERVDSIEMVCAQRDATPANLEAPSQRVYCWLKFLLTEDNLRYHLEALGQARAAAEALQPGPNRPIAVHLMNLASLWRKRTYGDVTLLKVNEGFLNAGPVVWEAMMRSAISGRDRTSDHVVREFAESEEFSEALFEMASFAGSDPEAARGHVHNLHDSFDRVNSAYFGGRLAKPSLVWNQALTVQKFGHYQPSQDTVMLSVSLDQPGVPTALVDYVMYHELLHKQHPVAVVNGRRRIHSPAFQKDERRFVDYEAVVRQLRELALRQRRA